MSKFSYMLQKMSRHCHPDCQRAAAAKEEDGNFDLGFELIVTIDALKTHLWFVCFFCLVDSAERAATVAANLISSARVILKLDREFTEYSAQYLVDNALVEKEPVKGPPQRSTLKIEDYIEYLVNMASPKTEAELEEMEKQRQRRSKITVKDCLECAFKEGIPRYEHWAHLGCVSKVPPFAALVPRVPVKGEVVEAKTLEDAFELLQHGPVGAKLHVFSPEIDLVGEDVQCLSLSLASYIY